MILVHAYKNLQRKMPVPHVGIQFINIGHHVLIIPVVLLDMNFSGMKTDLVGSSWKERCAFGTAIITFAPHALKILSKERVETAIGEMDAVRMVVDVQQMVGVVGILAIIHLYVPLMHNARP